MIDNERGDESDDICGLCDQPGADKVPQGQGGGWAYYPGEARPETEFVHAECESEESDRARDEMNADELRRWNRSPW